MQLREIHIDGFGIFANKHLGELTSGINVIYGRNESGKTTILEFIRRILFGFPRRSPRTNPYPALSGGAYGGKLVCELDDGNVVTMHRTEGTHGGPLVIQLDSDELTGQEELNRLVDHTTETFYKNVYAISLDELQAVRSLDEEEVRSRIYGAGLELGSTSLTDIKSESIRLGESYFKSRGSTQEMPMLYNEIKEIEQSIREMQHGLAGYDDLLMQRDGLAEEVEQLEEEISNLVSTRISLENMQKLYPSYLELVESQSALTELEDSPDVPSDALEKLGELKNELTGIQTRINEKEDDLKVLISKQDSVVFNEELIDLESTVISLQRYSEKYLSALRDLETVGLEREDLAEKIETEIAKLGEGWSEENVRKFELSHVKRDKLQVLKEKLSECERNMYSIKNKLELHQEREASELGRGFGGPEYYKYAIYAIAFLGVIGMITGFIMSQITLTIFSVFIAIISILVSLKIRNVAEIETEDPMEKKLKESLNDAQTDYTNIEKEWVDFLGSVNFEKSLTTDGAIEIVKAIETIKSDIFSLEDKENRIVRMQNTVDEVSELHDKVTPVIDPSRVSDNISSNIVMFDQYLEEEREKRKTKEGLEEQIRDLNTRINTFREQRESKEKEVENYISSVGVEDEQDLKEKYDVLLKRNELNSQIDGIKKLIQSAAGGGKHFENFLQSIAAITPEEIEVQLEEITGRIEESKMDRKEKTQTIGELKNQIEQLSSSEDLLVKQSKSEIRKQKLQDCAKDWVKSQVALFMLNTAISKYEETRQPEVIKEAADIFSIITDNKYPTIIMQAETNELLIRDSQGNNKNVVQMSRGTKEELYFAMRLGLIKKYENRAESMPVIIDDAIVNFDDERRLLAIQALEEFAENRQVIVLTCHENTLQAFEEYGINRVDIT